MRKTSQRCKDCKKKYAQEMGLCRACQTTRLGEQPKPNVWRPEPAALPDENLDNDAILGRAIAAMFARDSTEGLNLPGVGRLLRRLCDRAPNVAMEEKASV